MFADTQIRCPKNFPTTRVPPRAERRAKSRDISQGAHQQCQNKKRTKKKKRIFPIFINFARWSISPTRWPRKGIDLFLYCAHKLVVLPLLLIPSCSESVWEAMCLFGVLASTRTPTFGYIGTLAVHFRRPWSRIRVTTPARNGIISGRWWHRLAALEENGRGASFDYVVCERIKHKTI